jgi:hypothetical protein
MVGDMPLRIREQQAPRTKRIDDPENEINLDLFDIAITIWFHGGRSISMAFDIKSRDLR